MLRNLFKSSLNFSKNALSLEQQVRTTFILKRRYEPLLHRANCAPKRLRAKYYIYDLIEHTSNRKQNNLDVVLTQFVEGVGDKGDVVSMRPHFVYHQLLLPGLAVYKTDENVAKYAKTDVEKEVVTHSSPYAQRTVNMLQSLIVPVSMNKENPWVIEPWHIRTALRKMGYHCKDECITMPEKKIEGPDLTKEGKVFEVTITINKVEKAQVKFRLHHWSTDPSERLPYVFEYWKMPNENLFGISEEVKN